jgi:hypothetical protein
MKSLISETLEIARRLWKKGLCLFLIFGGTGCAALGQGGKGSISVIYYAPAWGPNTNCEEVVYFLKQVTFMSAATEQSRIYFCSIKPDGSERREIIWLWKDKPDQFLEPFALAAYLDINAATKRAALGIEMGERGGVFLFNLDGTCFNTVRPKEWKEDRPTKAGYPTWAPDGKWIAFQEYRFEKGFNLYRIVKCRPDGTEYKPLTERQASNTEPAWSPNGEVIAYTHYPKFYPGPSYLWFMDTNGTNKRNPGQNETFSNKKIIGYWGNKPRWSPDGKSILHDTSSMIDPVTGKLVRRYPYSKDRQGMQMWPKWGESGYVFVDSLKIGITSPQGDQTRPLLRNCSRPGTFSDLDKEMFRW